MTLTFSPKTPSTLCKTRLWYAIFRYGGTYLLHQSFFSSSGSKTNCFPSFNLVCPQALSGHFDNERRGRDIRIHLFLWPPCPFVLLHGIFSFSCWCFLPLLSQVSVVTPIKCINSSKPQGNLLRFVPSLGDYPRSLACPCCFPPLSSFPVEARSDFLP